MKTIRRRHALHEEARPSAGSDHEASEFTRRLRVRFGS